MDISFLLNHIMLFTLISVRIGSFIMLFPVFGGRTIPARFKAGISSLIALIMLPFVQFPDPPGSIWHFFFMILQETTIGILTGMLSAIVFEVFHSAGRYLGTEIGFGMVNVIDPQSTENATIIDIFLYFFSILTFFAINGHHTLIETMFHSYEIIPVGGIRLTHMFGQQIITCFAWMFYFAYLMAVPIVSAILIVHIALGVVAKTAPKVQVFLISFPLKIGMGLIMLYLLFPAVTILMSRVFVRLSEELYSALRHLS